MSIRYVDSWPKQIGVPGGILSNPSPEQCREHGYELRTDAMREAERLAAEEAASAAPYEISKIKLLLAFDDAGLFDDVWAFINADPRRRILWDAATALDSDDPMIAEAVAALMASTGLPFEQVDAIMRSARRVGI
jgi:hypothetical protein